ncbi:hypothetical protein GGP41_004507 [Bipolaris sorokiniana]|uniref:RNase III domain-containing protein n=1 Tax=Cochliobolus sativus TaxID=45130 RepID=A0A8H5Z7P8_COCSA|nr:hypothetical protein GGP41_004507 [Bipolaris sorokiniana]
MESVQVKIGYGFIHEKYLIDAFFAAHRSEKDGFASDGNRGMARIGQIAVEMAETSYAVLVEKAHLTDTNRRNYWWKDKKKVATACKVLDIEPHIVRSARQTGQELSVEVLNFALNAVIGAVWLDCQDQNRSIKDTCNTISRILGQINSSVSSPTTANDDQSVSLVAESSASIFSPGLVTHETPEENVVNDLEIRESSANLETYEEFSMFSPLSVLEEHHDLVTEQSSPQRFFLEQQPFPELDTVESVNQNHGHGNIVGSLLNETQGVRVQPVFLAHQERVIESITPGEADSSGSITATLKRALPGREPEDSVGTQDTGSLERKNKRAQTERGRFDAALESLLDAERQKVGLCSQSERAKLLGCVEYPQTAQLKDPFHVLKFLYLAIGSWNTLADFASQLQSVREARHSPALPPAICSAASMAFSMICRLDNERTTCILLKRYYAIEFLQDGQQASQPRESIQVETAVTFGLGNTRQRGNPQIRQEAAEIRFLTSKIAPDVEETSDEYSAVYDKVKRFRQLGKRLQILTKRFGIGVLVLLPSGPSFPGVSLTDRMLSDINMNDLAEFVTLLEKEQGPLLRKLSNAVAPTLLALAAFYQGQDTNPPPSLVDIESLKDTPKALLTLSTNHSYAI